VGAHGTSGEAETNHPKEDQMIHTTDQTFTFQTYRKEVEAAEMARGFAVETGEGTLQGKPGDFVLRDAGELTVCPREVFLQAYAPVD
jgi:hypothetical protein